MRSDYKKLGDFIRPIEERNSDGFLGEDNLYGISVTKEFIESHANLVGVTFENYKVVAPRHFAYIPDTSRRGDKIAISLNTFEEKIIVSSICTVFEIIDDNQLLPEYLMLWFMRPEFDRYARFMSNGSAREVFDWDCICGVEIPVPSLPEQRKIVRDCKIISNRIKILLKLNIILENLGDTYYRAFFEQHNDKLPVNWHHHTLSEFVPVITGKKDVNTTCKNGKYPFFSCSQDCLWTDESSFDADAILVAGNGDFNVKYYSGIFEAYQRTYVLIPKDKQLVGWLYFVIKLSLPKIIKAARGSVINFLTKGLLEDISFAIPDDLSELYYISDKFNKLLKLIKSNNDEVLCLKRMQSIYLTNIY